VAVAITGIALPGVRCKVTVRGEAPQDGGTRIMCLGIPGEIVDVRDDAGLRVGRVRFAGITRDICLEYVPEAAVGEYVLVHVGFAIARIDREEAERSYRILDEIGQLEEPTVDDGSSESSP
jgi:hydrogenase expression/formation protein HypC